MRIIIQQSLALFVLACTIIQFSFASTVPDTSSPTPLQWLKTKNYSQLESYYSSLQQKYEAGSVTEGDLFDGFHALYDSERMTEPFFNEWVSAYPHSYAARTERGAFYYRMAITVRGTESASKTSGIQMQAMEGFSEQSIADLKASLSMTAKPYMSALYLLDMEKYVGDAGSLRQWLDIANKIDPHNWLVRDRYMLALRPRWGGSYALMQAFLEECEKQDVPKSHLLTLESEMYADIAGSESDQKTKEDALARLKSLLQRTESMGIKPFQDVIKIYVEQTIKLNRYDEALPWLEALAKNKAQEPWVYSNLGWIYIKQNRIREAWNSVNIGAKMNDAWSEFSVGKTLYLGCKDINLQPDKKAGLMWLYKSADQGDTDAKAFLQSLTAEVKNCDPMDLMCWFQKLPLLK